eukprot:370172-Pyramimonas_sp.AAC.1
MMLFVSVLGRPRRTSHCRGGAVVAALSVHAWICARIALSWARARCAAVIASLWECPYRCRPCTRGSWFWIRGLAPRSCLPGATSAGWGFVKYALRSIRPVVYGAIPGPVQSLARAELRAFLQAGLTAWTWTLCFRVVFGGQTRMSGRPSGEI